MGENDGVRSKEEASPLFLLCLLLVGFGAKRNRKPG